MPKQKPYYICKEIEFEGIQAFLNKKFKLGYRLTSINPDSSRYAIVVMELNPTIVIPPMPY